MQKPSQREQDIGRRLRLRDLSIFFAVVKSGSMSKTAAQLGISTPSVSEVVANLERAVGVRLLDRSSRGVLATPYGKALLKRGEVAFDELRQGIREIEFLADPTSGEIKMACPESIAAILPPIIESFYRQYPRAVLDVYEENLNTFAPKLQDRSLDFALLRLPGKSIAADQMFDDLNVEFLFDDELVVAAGRHSRWAKRRKIALAELVNEDWILTAPEAWNYRIVAEAFRAQGLDMPRISLKTFSFHLRANLLASGHFLTALPKSVLQLYAERFSLMVLPIDLPSRAWPVAIVTLKNRTLSPLAERFIACARDAMNSAPVQRRVSPRTGSKAERTTD